MADHIQRVTHQCQCPGCRTASRDEVARDHAAINCVVAGLDERQRRLFAGLLALRQGHGGIIAVARVTGLSRTTIRRGIQELRAGLGAASDRIRRPGAGRRALEKKRPRW